MGDLYVCAGAALECNFGSETSDLMVVAPHNIKISGELMATMTDNAPMVNIMPFGECSNILNPMVAAATAANQGKLQEMPCIPVTPFPWLNVKMTVRVNGVPTVLESSTLMCVYGGVIQVNDSGQEIVKDG